MKPGSCGPGVLGVYPVIYDEDGSEVAAGSGTAGSGHQKIGVVG
jgi:acetyl-CoA synthetase